MPPDEEDPILTMFKYEMIAGDEDEEDLLADLCQLDEGGSDDA